MNPERAATPGRNINQYLTGMIPFHTMDMDSFHRLLGETAAARMVRARAQRLDQLRDTGTGLEPVRVLDHVAYINDSGSTHLDATLRTMADLDRPVLWIAGALDASIGQPHVSEFLRERIVALVLHGKRAGQGIEALKPFTEHVYTTSELRTAVFVARELARAGEAVLFSPACPASDTHTDAASRELQFLHAVSDL